MATTDHSSKPTANAAFGTETRNRRLEEITAEQVGRLQDQPA